MDIYVIHFLIERIFMATTNYWGDRFHIYCNHEHTIKDEDGQEVDQPIEFVPQEGKSTFFTCPKYWEIDEQHPFGHHEDEKQCLNNLGFNDYKRIITYLEKEYEKQIASGEFIVDLTDFKFSVGLIDVIVLHQDSNDELYLGITNRKAIYAKR